jgi:hypothetical protein
MCVPHFATCVQAVVITIIYAGTLTYLLAQLVDRVCNGLRVSVEEEHVTFPSFWVLFFWGEGGVSPSSCFYNVDT